MPEKTIELDLPFVLPGVEAPECGCVARLEHALENAAGLRRVHLEVDREPAAVCLHYDPDVLTLAQVRQLAAQAGARIVRRYRHDLLAIEGMDCSDCARVLEHSVGRLDGVLAVTVNFAAEKMRVEYDARQVTRGSIERRVRGTGYALPASGWRRVYSANRELIFSLGAGLLLGLGWIGATFLGWSAPLAWGFYLAAYLLGGWDVARHAVHALRAGHFDTDLLMGLAALGAAALGEWAEGALLLCLFSLGHALQERALDRARAAVRALSALTPKTARVRRAGRESELPVAQLQLDDVAVVRPGARVPVDGVVLAGHSEVNQAPVTGEALPVEKGPGQLVFAGSVNGAGALEVRVTRLAKDSTLARVMQLVEAAQAQKSPAQRSVEQFERRFVPAVLLLTGLVMIVPPLFGWLSLAQAVQRALLLLVAASPCALALGTPAAVLAAVAQAARNGVLVKGGAPLEALGQLTAIAFDKTGTLTHGRPAVTDVIGREQWSAGDAPAAWPVDRWLAWAAAAESRSGHPLAQAVVRAAEARGLALPAVERVEALEGRGLRAAVAGHTLWVGNARLLEEAGVPVSREARARLEALTSRGRMAMGVAVDGELAGLIALADTVRAEAAEALTALRRLGVQHFALLTGDHASAAVPLAAGLGVTDVRAGLLPEDKLAAIRELGARHGALAMVGDGVNDAPALAQATVGIALGSAGTEVALETADVALLGDDLTRLPFAISLGRAMRAVIVQNLAIALGVIGLLILAALTGWAGLGLAVVLHEGSTLVVVLNALRLLGHSGRA